MKKNIKPSLLKILLGEFGVDSFYQKKIFKGIITLIPTVLLILIYISSIICCTINTVGISVLNNEYKNQTPTPYFAHLKPKLFEAGTGFWDGTQKYTNVVIDQYYYEPAISDLELVGEYSLPNGDNRLLWNFTYDRYMALNESIDYNYTLGELNKFRKNGYCDFDESDVINTFVVLDSKRCPVVEVKKELMPGNIYLCSAIKYLTYVNDSYEPIYSEIPKFILGTDQYGISKVYTVVPNILSFFLIINITISFMIFILLSIIKCTCIISGVTSIVSDIYKQNKLKKN